MGVGAAVAGLAMAGASAYGASQTSQGPGLYDTAEQTRDNVKSLGLFGPQALLLNRLYGPAFSNISNQTSWQSLFGSPGQNVNTTLWVAGKPVKTTLRRPSTKGLLDLYQKAGGQMADFNRQQTLQDLKFAPQAMDAYMNANPLMRSLQERAQQGLDQGGELDASTRRTLQQSAFGDASMRGFGHSPLDAFMAYSAMGAESEARKRQREQFAMQAQGMLPDPFSLTRTPSFATTMGPAIGMQGAQWGRQSSVPALNPFAFNQHSQTAADNTTSNILGAISGGMMNYAGNAFGQYMAKRNAGNKYGSMSDADFHGDY